MAGTQLSHRTLGLLTILRAQISASGRRVFTANRKVEGRRAQEQLIVCADAVYWIDPAERVLALWESLAPKLKLTARPTLVTYEDAAIQMEELAA